MEDELARVLVEDRDAGDVARQQIRRELDPLPRRSECACEAARERRLPDARDVLQQQVALGEQADEGEVDHLGLALDEAVDRGRDPAGRLPGTRLRRPPKAEPGSPGVPRDCHALAHPATRSPSDRGLGDRFPLADSDHVPDRLEIGSAEPGVWFEMCPLGPLVPGIDEQERRPIAAHGLSRRAREPPPERQRIGAVEDVGRLAPSRRVVPARHHARVHAQPMRAGRREIGAIDCSVVGVDLALECRGQPAGQVPDRPESYAGQRRKPYESVDDVLDAVAAAPRNAVNDCTARTCRPPRPSSCARSFHRAIAAAALSICPTR